jgi:thiol-disulfide isomerase/thioredoxin
MIIEIYGKQDCKLCESAKRKIAHFLQKWNVNENVQVVFRDMETEEGAAEGDFFDVFEIPSVLLKEDRDSVVARWDGQAPPSEELQRRLCA